MTATVTSRLTSAIADSLQSARSIPNAVILRSSGETKPSVSGKLIANFNEPTRLTRGVHGGTVFASPSNPNRKDMNEFVSSSHLFGGKMSTREKKRLAPNQFLEWAKVVVAVLRIVYDVWHR